MARPIASCAACGKALSREALALSTCSLCGAAVSPKEAPGAPQPSRPWSVRSLDTLGTLPAAKAEVRTEAKAPASTPARKATRMLRAYRGSDLAPRATFTVQGRGDPSPGTMGAPALGEAPLVEDLPAGKMAVAPEIVEPPAEEPEPDEAQRALILEEEPALPKTLPSAVLETSSLEYGGRPDPGVQSPPFLWRDVVMGEAPARMKAGEGSYAVYHSIEVDADVRITYQTLVSTRTVKTEGDGVDHILVADSRVSVQKRALLDVMDKVRSAADHHAHKARASLGRRIARHREAVMAWPGRTTRLGFALVRAEARASQEFINLRRQVLRGAVEVPDKILSSTLRVEYHLATRMGRQSLWEGVKDPTGMSAEQRSVMLFLTAVLLGGLILLANSFFALITPEYAGVYRRVLLEAALQFVGLFGAPILMEPIIILSTLAIGPVLAFTGPFVGKMLAAWVLYLLGDSLHGVLNKKVKGGRGKRMVDWLQHNANKWGLLVLILANALPLAPDQIMLVLAVSGIRFRTWMLGIGLGTAIKFTALVAGAIVLGPGPIESFFSNPFGL